MSEKLEKLSEELAKQLGGPNHGVNFKTGIIRGVKEQDGRKEFLNERSMGVAHKTKRTVVHEIGGNAMEDERVTIDYLLEFRAREWAYCGEHGWIDGGWIEIRTKGMTLDELTPPLLRECTLKAADAITDGMVARTNLMQQVDAIGTDMLANDPNDVTFLSALFTTHSYNPENPFAIGSQILGHRPLSRPKVTASVEYPFNSEFDYDKWRLIEWLGRKCQGGFRFSMVRPSEGGDRYPFPMLKSPRGIWFENPRDATFFRMKWI